MTEAELAARLHRDLGPLASDASWTTSPSTGQSEGSYSDPIADAKETAGIEGDLADVTAAVLKKVRRLALGYCFDRLVIHYTTAVDYSQDGQSESQSQILTNIQRAREASIGQVAIGATLRGQGRPDWTAGYGNVSDEPAV